MMMFAYSLWSFLKRLQCSIVNRRDVFWGARGRGRRVMSGFLLDDDVCSIFVCATGGRWIAEATASWALFFFLCSWLIVGCRPVPLAVLHGLLPCSLFERVSTRGVTACHRRSSHKKIALARLKQNSFTRENKLRGTPRSTNEARVYLSVAVDLHESR